MSSGLSQDDFRKLLQTPRAAAPDGAAPTAAAAPGAQPAPGKNAKARRTEKWKARQKELEEKRAAGDTATYRAERRKGENLDYAEHETLLSAYKAAAAAEPALLGGDDEGDGAVQDVRQREIDKSKYLGGDIDHTHLVKGLDYALLQKTRTELQTTNGASDPQAEGAAPAGEAAPSKAKPEELKFHTRMARGVHTALFGSGVPTRNELFQPGRMAFYMDLETQPRRGLEPPVPTTVVRSKADCPDLATSVQRMSTNDVVVNKLIEIISYVRIGSRGGKRMKRKEKKTKAIVGKPADADLDLFADAGEYAGPTPRGKMPGPPPLAAAGGYFSKPDIAQGSAAAAAPVPAAAAKPVPELYPADLIKEVSDLPGAEPTATPEDAPAAPAPVGGNRRERRKLAKAAAAAAQASGSGAAPAPPAALALAAAENDEVDPTAPLPAEGPAAKRARRIETEGYRNIAEAMRGDYGEEYLPGAQGFSMMAYEDDSDDEGKGSGPAKASKDLAGDDSARKRAQKEKQDLNRDWQQVNAAIEKRKADKAAGGDAKKAKE